MTKFTSKSVSKNRLSEQSSPYLLQHAENPVEWWPWCEEALIEAKEKNKPILLSIGYSACHWCHVMAHESFENADIAAVMNQLFVNIKVDREERPDLDKIYQQAHQLLNQRAGGWPLTVFLAADDLTPFFAGTYFPDKPRHGMPAFTEILQQIAAFYQENKPAISTQNESLRAAMQPPLPQTASVLDTQPLHAARHQLGQHFDQTYGGFGAAPKFPHPSNLQRLLKHWKQSKINQNEDKDAKHMLSLTLHAMASGGIYDQLGGGFYRYSVDEKWVIPHFEKMLYDNGALLSLYAEVWHTLEDTVFKRITEETAQWVIREMQSPEGGYYSTLDADSEGKEGQFYVWSNNEIKNLLTKDECQVVTDVFGFNQTANFEGRWHLHVYQNLRHVAERLNIEEKKAHQLLSQAKEKLLQQRQTRIHPGRDEKILTAWNGLMISGMAKAGRLLDRDDFLDSAEEAIEFIHDKLYIKNRLLANYKDGKAKLMAYLDDYVFLIQGLLEFLQARWNSKYLNFAIELADTVLEYFEDKKDGGFYFTANDHEKLFFRPKPAMDDAIPAGNAIAALTLNRLGHLLGETRYLQSAEKSLLHFHHAMNQIPYAFCSLLDALDEHITPAIIIVIRDEIKNKEQWLSVKISRTENILLFFIPKTVSNLPGLLSNHAYEQGGIAYLCQGNTCYPPATSPEQLIYLIEQRA